MTVSYPNEGDKVYWRKAGAEAATPYNLGFWFPVTDDLVQLPAASEYPTAGPVLNRTEIEWVASPP